MIRQTTIVRLETQLDALETILAGATPETLMTRPPSGAWSAHEHLAHLARHHDIFLDRLHRVAAENTPRFARYRAEDDPAWPGWAALPTDEAIARLKDLRARIIAHVNALSESTAQRTGIHPLFGEQSIGEMLEFFLAHEGHHLYQLMLRLATARNAARAAPGP
jgi:uncharacterized damage-inducible protein DinB